MYLKALNDCQDGEILGKDVCDSTGRILLKSGTRLNDKLLSTLDKIGIESIVIKDEWEHLNDSVSMDLKIKSLNTIRDTFEKISDNKNNAVSVINENIDEFKVIVNNILEELQGNKEILSLVTNIQLYDKYTFEHSFNVMIYSLQIALRLGIMGKELNDLGLGALLHDIGKMLIPYDILNKKGKLTDEEFDIIKEHTSFGFNILRKSHSLTAVIAHCAYQHHEREDGSGYPRGLESKEIHRFAKIIAVADVYDALVNDRAYRKAMLPHEVIELLYSDATNGKFDMDIVIALKNSVKIYNEGSVVLLSDGSVGYVTQYDFRYPARPVIRVVKNVFDEEVDYELDMSKELNIMIKEIIK